MKIQGNAPALSLYKALDTHDQEHQEGNSHVPEIVKKGVFLAEKAVILEIRGTIFNV